MLVLFLGCQKKEPPHVEVKREIKTHQVSIQKVQVFVEATGTVQLDLDGGAKIVSPLAGTVEKILVRIGQSVKRGTPLIAIRSSDVSDTHATFLSIQAQVKQAERNYDLNKKLFEIGAVTKNDFLASEASYEQTKALAAGIKRKLDIYGSSPGGNMRDTLTLKAPIDGRVVDIQAHIGDRFDTSTALMMVANPAKSFIVANIYDTDIEKVSSGREVTFTSDVFPREIFKGVITYVSDMEDPDSKTIKTYLKPLTGTNLFKPNMFMKIRIADGEKPLPVVPKNCVIYKEGKFYVQVKKDNQFEMKEVKPVLDVSDKLMAIEGVREGDIIAGAAIDLEQP